MFGIILLYWIGKYFYQLAEKFNKHKWGFAILGIALYYGSQFFIGIILGIFNEIFLLGIDFNSIGVNLMGIPIGLLSCYFLYKLLDKKWQATYVNPLEEIDAIGETSE